MSKRSKKKALAERGSAALAGYDSVLTEVVRPLEDSRRASAMAVNAVDCHMLGGRPADR